MRELYGVQTAQRADRAAFVALGSYSTDAREFAAQVGMTLVDGEELLEIISTGLRGEALKLPTPTTASAPPVPALRGGDGAANGTPGATRRP